MKNKGFTIVELSIVLVLVGLLSAGVLVGRDLIRAAEVRAQIRQIESLNTAVAAFQNKYNCLPGDCVNGVEYNLCEGESQCVNGNGDGVLMGDATATLNTAYGELGGFWYMLGTSQLIEVRPPWGHIPGINTPALKMGGAGKGTGSLANNKGGIMIQSQLAYMLVLPETPHAWVLAARAAISASDPGAQAAGVYLPIDTYRLDSKIDDGFPLTGTMRAAGRLVASVPPFPPCHVPAPPGTCPGIRTFVSLSSSGPDAVLSTGDDITDACIDDSVKPSIYNLRAKDLTATSLCAPVIGAAF